MAALDASLVELDLPIAESGVRVVCGRTLPMVFAGSFVWRASFLPLATRGELSREPALYDSGLRRGSDEQHRTHVQFESRLACKRRWRHVPDAIKLPKRQYCHEHPRNVQVRNERAKPMRYSILVNRMLRAVSARGDCLPTTRPGPGRSCHRAEHSGSEALRMRCPLSGAPWDRRPVQGLACSRTRTIGSR